MKRRRYQTRLLLDAMLVSAPGLAAFLAVVLMRGLGAVALLILGIAVVAASALVALRAQHLEQHFAPPG